MASGDTLVSLIPQAAVPSDTNPATGDQFVGTGDTDGHVYYVLDFNASTPEHADFSFVMPRHYGGGGLTITLYWSTNATGNCIWQTAFKSVSDDADDLDTKAYATAQSSAAAGAPSAAGEVDYITTTHTSGQIDGVAAGELCFFRVTRDASNGSDTLSGDAELHAVEIKET